MRRSAGGRTMSDMKHGADTIRREELLELARSHELRGDLERAAQTFERAGDLGEAARLHVAERRFVAAGHLLLRSIEFTRRKTSEIDPKKREVALLAVDHFRKGGQIKQAVEVLLGLAERRRAVDLLRSVGEHAEAARIAGRPERRVEPPAHRDHSLPVDEWGRLETGVKRNLEAAARKLEAEDKQEAALESYVRAERFADAARLAGRLGNPGRAAELFARGDLPFEAAAAYREAGALQDCLGQLVRVPIEHPYYREACAEVIGLAQGLPGLEAEVAYFLAGFAATGPYGDGEVDVFYTLAEYYERNGARESARGCYRVLLEKRPGYRDAAARLRALEEGPAQDPPQEDAPAAPVPEEVVSSPSRTGTIYGTPPSPQVPLVPPSPRTPSTSSHPSGEIAMLVEGALVSGRYQIGQRIGRGGMGVVFDAHDLELEESVAIKFFSAALADDATLGRFKQEVSLSRKFNHPNIIRLYDIGTYGDYKYITMELLAGRNLDTVIDGRPLDLDVGLGYLVQACSALQCVHDANVVHRDLKPDNFFVTDGGVLKVMDFGVAKRPNASKALTRAGMIVGTPHYMAPEQINNFAAVTHLADLYALGCIAYEIFTGEVPFNHDEFAPLLGMHLTHEPTPPRTKNPKIPVDVEAIILQLLAKQPAARIQSCRELGSQLDRLRVR